jgi:signal transduction histidine kinase
VDVAYGLTHLAASKLVVYTFGTLVHLFLMVLIVGNRRLRRLEWLLFALMSALFMWYAGNLLALNISLRYGAAPALLAGFAGVVSLMGFVAAVPLLVEVQTEYLARFVPLRVGQRVLAASFYLPVVACPWIVGRLLRRLGVEPMVALGRPLRWLVLWAVAALLFAAGINVYSSARRLAVEPALAKFHAYLAGFQVVLALGWGIAYLPHALPPVGGLGGYLSAGLMALGIFPSGLIGYLVYRYNFLDLRVQRNLVYSAVAIFGSLLYLNLMRRVSGWLESYFIPEAATEAVMIFVLVILVEPLKRLMHRALHRQFLSEFETVQKLATEIEEHAKRTGDMATLAAVVEERVPPALGLERVRLRRGPISEDASAGPVPSNVRRLPVTRGGETIAYLEVVPGAGGISGEQAAALEILADRLTGALELCRLIADKINLERELAAKEKMAFLGEMAARIAHNVKNPLSGMKTIVQLMQEDAALPEASRRDCRMLVGEIDRLNQNISQVLRFAKPARDADRPADLASVVRRVVAISRLEAERRHIRLEVSATGACFIEGGEEAASDIVSNLLVNALEASDDGRTIRIGLARAGGLQAGVELSVEDEGRGIPKDRLDKIFQPFFTTRAGGTGLGLAIVKRRLEEIGGAVRCQSPVSGENATSAPPGTRFVVRFRLAAAANESGFETADSGPGKNAQRESPGAAPPRRPTL